MFVRDWGPSSNERLIALSSLTYVSVVLSLDRKSESMKRAR
jgi:hypothetical protein